MTTALTPLLTRRAIRVFDQHRIPPEVRRQLLDATRSAPSSFNMQPYRFYWIESPSLREIACTYCLSQLPAQTASALIVAVADINSYQSTLAAQLAWMRQVGMASDKIADYERKSVGAKWFFKQGIFCSLGLLKWCILRTWHLWKPMGMVPFTRQGLFKWATKNTALACENLMIAAEALGLSTCPMDGFDGLRFSRLLGLSTRYHEIVMVIAIGKKSSQNIDQPQWRRPIDETVTIL